MRHFISALIVALLVPALAHGDLTLVQDVVTEGSTARMTMKIKGSKVRVDSTPMATAIIDTESGDMTNLIHPQKMVMRMSGAQLKDMAAAFQAPASDKPAVTTEPKPTGKKETINGHPTEEYTMEVQGARMRLWIAKDYPDWKALVTDLSRMSQGNWAKQLQQPGQPHYDMAKLPGMALRTEVKLPGGGNITMQVQSMDRKEIPASEFEIPSGYKEMKMPAMGIPATAEP